MICQSCHQEVYHYRAYFDNGTIVQNCRNCSYDRFPGLSTEEKLIDWKTGLKMSPAEYHYVTHLVIGEGGKPYEDKTGKYIEKTLIGKLKQRLPN